jgi:tetratricopeptide (TPR) repeat protein
VELVRHGEYGQAREVLKGVAPPNSADQQVAFHRLKAAVAAGLKEKEEAAREMQEALALRPEDSDLLLATAVAEVAAGDLQKAFSHASLSQESPTREALLGQILEARKDSEAAALAYRTAIKLAPEAEAYRLMLGLVLIRSQRSSEAVVALTESMHALPKSAKIRTLLGVAQYEAGYPDDAIHTLEDAIELTPGASAPRAALARIVLQSSGAPTQKTTNELCAGNAIVCAALHLRTAREKGDQTLIIRATETLKLGSQSDPIRNCELARAYEWSGEWTAARSVLERCVELDSSPQNHYRLGLLYHRLGLTEQAEHEMQIRRELLRHMSEQTALGQSALRGSGLGEQ